MLLLSTNFDIIYNVDVLFYWDSIFEFNDNISTRIVQSGAETKLKFLCKQTHSFVVSLVISVS